MEEGTGPVIESDVLVEESIEKVFPDVWPVDEVAVVVEQDTDASRTELVLVWSASMLVTYVWCGRRFKRDSGGIARETSGSKIEEDAFDGEEVEDKETAGGPLGVDC